MRPVPYRQGRASLVRGLVLLAILASACQPQCRIMGDAPRFDVILANATDQGIEVTITDGSSRTMTLSLALQEDQPSKSWLIPQSESDIALTVSAKDSSGAAIFC